jgi:hypothetical protein
LKVALNTIKQENKFASKALLSKVGKTLMGRLSYIRHQNQQKSRFRRIFSAVSVLGLNPKVSAKVALILTR